MPTEQEYVCCQELHSFAYRLEEVNKPCITAHEGFIANCTNRRVLETSFWEFNQTYGPVYDLEPRHEQDVLCMESDVPT